MSAKLIQDHSPLSSGASVIVRSLRGSICVFAYLFGLIILASCQTGQASRAPIKVGIIAPLSGPLGPSGQAIQRGMLLAIEEVNRQGGVLGRPLALVTRDLQNNPSEGVTALRELVQEHSIVAVFGGIFSPVMVAQLDAIHELQVPLINPWGSMAAITKNGRHPNFAFRVSVSDEHADEFLVRYALEVIGAHRPGIVADTTGWGNSNVAGLKDWLARLGIAPAGIERFDQGDTNMNVQLRRLRERGADALLIIANAPEGAAIVRGMATLGWKIPLVSHWGISGGQFVKLAGMENTEGVLTLQTYSFFGPLSPKGDAVLQAYYSSFETRRVEEILAPVGVAHGYDGVHLLARALKKAGTTAGAQVRDALEQLEPYDGLVKQYAPAFTPDRHDALLAKDYMMAVWQGDRLVPAPRPRLKQ